MPSRTSLGPPVPPRPCERTVGGAEGRANGFVGLGARQYSRLRPQVEPPLWLSSDRSYLIIFKRFTYTGTLFMGARRIINQLMRCTGFTMYHPGAGELISNFDAISHYHSPISKWLVKQRIVLGTWNGWRYRKETLLPPSTSQPGEVFAGERSPIENWRINYL